MIDPKKTRQQLIAENDELRQRVAALEGVNADRRRAEENLAKSQAILTAAIECLPFDFFALDAEGRCILQNTVSRQYYGNALGKTTEEVCLDERILARWLEKNRRALAGERVEGDVELAIQGEHHHLHNIITPICSDGEVLGILGVNIDITEQKQAQRALQQSEERYRTLAEISPDVIYILDTSGSLLYANRTAAAYMGLSPTALVGKTQHELFPPDKVPQHMEHIRTVLATGDAGEMEELYRFGSRDVWLNVRSIPIRDEQGRVTSVMGICRNVTDRKQAEQALRESERRLSTLMSNLPGMAYRCKNDPDRTMEFISDGCLPLLGYDPSQMMCDRAACVGNLIHPDDRQMVWEQVQQAIAERRRFQLTYRIRTAQGVDKWAWEQGVGIFSANGELEALEGFIIDITERKNSQVALQRAHDELEEKVRERTAELREANVRLQREVEERRHTEQQLAIFKRFAEASGQGFGMADLQGNIIYVNPALCRLLGETSSPDAIGKHFSAYCREEDRQHIHEDIIPTVLSQGQWSGESTLRTRQGEVIPTLENTFLVCDEAGQPSHLAIAVTDLSERKRAEEEVQRSRDELQAIYDGMVDGMHIVNLSTMKAVRVNSALCRMTGYSEEEALSLSQADVHPPEALPEIPERVQLHAKGQVSLESEVPLVRKDGTVFYADITTSPILYNEAPCLMCFFRDTTERRKAQQALERERQSLWRMLQASDHERQIIAYDIHDGLTQYLAAATMQFQSHNALRETSPDEAKKAYETAVELVRQCHSEARRLISEVRPPVIDEIGLETALSHLVHEQRRHGGPKIHFDSNVQFDRLPPILENAIYRIVQEALTNACKHSASKEVKVTMTQDDQDVWLEVRDWGIGFDPEAVETGHFGLEGIRQRVRLLGGRLAIESAPDFGTLVQVVVPVVEIQTPG